MEEEVMITPVEDLLGQISAQSSLMDGRNSGKEGDSDVENYRKLYELYLKTIDSDLKREELELRTSDLDIRKAELDFKKQDAELSKRREKKEDIKFWAKIILETICTGSTLFLGLITTKHSVELGKIPGDPTQNGWMKELMKKK